MARKVLTALGIEIYHGSYTLGVQRAGFKTLGHLESTSYAVKSAKLNLPHLDIRPNNEWGDLTRYAAPDLIYANPPCAIWSSASKHFTSGRDGNIGKDAWQTDPRLELHRHIHDTARSLRPRTFALESIMNAWKHGRTFWIDQARRWADYGYSVTFLLQNNCYLSLDSPQNRKRMFLIAHQYPLIWPDFVEPRTTGQILATVPPVPADKKRWLKPFMRELWEQAPEVSGCLSRVVRDGLVVKKPGDGVPSFLCRRAFPREIPNVYMSDSTRLHPTEPRYYDRSEVLALCGMPQDWQASCGWAQESMEMARCVLPGVGQYVATAVLNGFAKRPLRQQTFEICDFRNAMAPTVEGFDVEEEAA